MEGRETIESDGSQKGTVVCAETERNGGYKAETVEEKNGQCRRQGPYEYGYDEYIERVPSSEDQTDQLSSRPSH